MAAPGPLKRFGRLLGGFGPAMGRRPLPEILRPALGVGLAMALADVAISALHGDRANGLFLVSGLASSAVLIFAIPNSPLAQPWSAFMGMVISAEAAVAATSFVPYPFATGAALAGAVAGMMALRALHPPAAGVALFVVLEAEAGRPVHPLFPLFPVGALMAGLIGLALLWHRLFRQRYPNRLPRIADAPRPASGLDAAALEKMLLDFRQSTNIAPEDLERLTAAVAARAAQTLLATTPARTIMHPAVTVGPEMPMRELIARMRAGRLRVLAVADSEGSLLGLVDQSRLIAALAAGYGQPSRTFLAREPQAAELMDPLPRPVAADLPLAALLARFAEPGALPVPVLDGGRLVGMVGRADLVSALTSRAPGFDPGAASSDQTR
ncbi:HPP family protein [Rhodobacter maris]|uniref:Tryptophan synthase alpha chain n=1 Tax=Rhodobacter maris TaxID=446682 RepID=A0A285S6A7_9RHOB|nr:HPP family protein [Rhodobacter maris]SOC02928.1 tryptophan synthase alpha chain [Rhodobacter maris]